jgi:hypothetical protein
VGDVVDALLMDVDAPDAQKRERNKKQRDVRDAHAHNRRTTRLTDAGPVVSDSQQKRDPGVRCSRLVRCHVFSFRFVALKSGRKAARIPTGNPVTRAKNNAELQLLHHGRSASDSETSDAGGMVDSQQLNANHSEPTTPPTMQHRRIPFLMFGYFT